MPSSVYVETTLTFEGTPIFIGCEPKTDFESGAQARTKPAKQEAGKPDLPGLLKWELHIAAKFRTSFRPAPEVIVVGIASDRNPAEGLMPGTPVELRSLQYGSMDKQIRDRETGQRSLGGAQNWWRCEAVRPISAVPNGRKSEHQPAPAA
jgi:hypothetical protein